MPADFELPNAHPSPLHRWRMPEKWLGFLALLLAMSAVRDMHAALAGLAVALVVFMVGGCRGQARRVLLIATPLVLLIVPATALAVAPRAEVFLGVAYSAEGLRVGSVTVLRCVALLLLAAALVATTPAGGLFASLSRLGAPRRMVEVLWLAERFIRGVGLEGHRLRRAATCRGYVLTPRLGDLRTFGALAGAHLVRSLQRSERVHQVMSARGYSGDLRTAEPRARTIADWALLVVFVLAAAALAFPRGWW